MASDFDEDEARLFQNPDFVKAYYNVSLAEILVKASADMRAMMKRKGIEPEEVPDHLIARVSSLTQKIKQLMDSKSGISEDDIQEIRDISSEIEKLK